MLSAVATYATVSGEPRTASMQAGRPLIEQHHPELFLRCICQLASPCLWVWCAHPRFVCLSSSPFLLQYQSSLCLLIGCKGRITSLLQVLNPPIDKIAFDAGQLRLLWYAASHLSFTASQGRAHSCISAPSTMSVMFIHTYICSLVDNSSWMCITSACNCCLPGKFAIIAVEGRCTNSR